MLVFYRLGISKFILFAHNIITINALKYCRLLRCQKFVVPADRLRSVIWPALTWPYLYPLPIANSAN